MMWNRRDILGLGAGSLALAALPMQAHAQSADWASAPFAAADGSGTSLSAFIGRPIVLNFWATWCVPCRSEMPSLDALQASMGDAVAVVPVSVDDAGMPIIDQFYDQYDLVHLNKYHDTVGALAEAFAVTAYPTSYLINKRGVIAGVYARAFDWNSALARAAITALAR